MRTDPPFIATERDMLTNFLDYQRETLALKCEGLSPEQLKHPAVAPSTLTLLGLVRHMAEVERIWFGRTLMGEEEKPLYYTDEHPDGEFDLVAAASVEEAFATWREQIESARAHTAAHDSLDAVAKRQRHGNDVTLRWILVHMIEEYARHNGHADILREQIDGVTGE